MKIWVENAKLAKAVAQLVEHVLPGNNSLTEREREIAVSLINSTWHAAYSTDLHARRLEQLGVPAETVEALAVSLTLAFYDVPAGAPGMPR